MNDKLKGPLIPIATLLVVICALAFGKWACAPEQPPGVPETLIRRDPEEERERAARDEEDKAARKRATDDVAIKLAGRLVLINRLRDPDSLQIIDDGVVRPGRNGGEYGYWCRYRAKNGFGGYNVEDFYTE
jgi:hypothetical protein